MQSKRTDIVFVFPPAHGNVGAFKNHLGVAYLRSALAQQDIRAVQYLNETPGTVRSVAADILRSQPRVVGFTTYDANFILALAIARHIKQQRPDVQVVFGGPTATFGGAQLLEKHDAIDVCVTGEAEETGGLIFGLLLDGHPLDETQPGVVFRRDGKVIATALPPLVGCDKPSVQSALDSTPSPYLTGTLTDGRAGVLSGRGCTHNCQYCAFAALGRKKLRLHSIERVIAELEFIAAQQKRTGDKYIVAIHDDAFTLLPKRAKTLCQTIADRNLGLVLSCITRADAIDEELLRLMREAGFMSLAFGLESAVPSVLRATGKVRVPNWRNPDLEPERQFIEQVRTSVTQAKKLGFNVGVSIILGLPTETEKDGAATLRFVKTLPVDFYMHNFLWVFPGTPLWETHERYGVGCALNSMGLPTTYRYAYDLTRLRPRPKCALEQDAKSIQLLAADAFYACQSFVDTEGSINTVIVDAPELELKTAEWLSQTMSVGSILLQAYPPIPRRQEPLKLYTDRCMVSDQLLPARHHIQMLPRAAQEPTERWRVACAGTDLYAKHKPELTTVTLSQTSDPLVDWLKGIRTTLALGEVSAYLSQPDELIDFLDRFSDEELGSQLGNMPIPPGLKYPGRWLNGRAPCLSLSRIEIDEQGQVRTCRHGEPIGQVGDTRAELVKRLEEKTREIELQRGCAECPNTHCPRCPFPGIDSKNYCDLMTKQARAMHLINYVHLYSRLPLILNSQRDRVGSD